MRMLLNTANRVQQLECHKVLRCILMLVSIQPFAIYSFCYLILSGTLALQLPSNRTSSLERVGQSRLDISAHVTLADETLPHIQAGA